MEFSDLDRVLEAWRGRHGLHVLTRYRDEEVRAIPIVDDAGGEYELWLTKPDARGRLMVTAVQPKVAREDFQTHIDDLLRALESAYQRVERWIAEAGRTRTPVL